MAQFQKFCLTLNNYTTEEEDALRAFCAENAAFAVVGREVGAQGTPHLQGYVNLRREKKRTLHALKKELWGKRAHLERARSTDTDNNKYCGKEKDVWTHGTPVRQGQRSDLDEVRVRLDGPDSMKSIARDHISTWMRYGRMMEAYRALPETETKRDFKTHVIVLIGGTGTGKTRYCTERAASIGGGLFERMRGDYWDGYNGQRCVIIDDFYGWIKYDEMLRLCDRYGMRVHRKGSMVVFNSTHIFITSNRPVEHWYSFVGYTGKELLRRVDELYVDTIPALEPAVLIPTDSNNDN